MIKRHRITNEPGLKLIITAGIGSRGRTNSMAYSKKLFKIDIASLNKKDSVKLLLLYTGSITTGRH